MLGVANPPHLQVRIHVKTLPLQVVVATESQAARVSVPPPPASGTDFVQMTKVCFCTVCSHVTVEIKDRWTNLPYVDCKSSECPDSQSNALQVVGVPGLAEQCSASRRDARTRRASNVKN